MIKCRCGRLMRRSPGSSKTCCYLCASRGKRLKAELPEPFAVCPRCVGRGPLDCCACLGSRRLTLPVLFGLCHNVWARPACGCGTCRALSAAETQLFKESPHAPVRAPRSRPVPVRPARVG